MIEKTVTIKVSYLIALVVLCIIMSTLIFLAVEGYKAEKQEIMTQEAIEDFSIAFSVESYILDILRAPDSLKPAKKAIYARYVDSLKNPKRYEGIVK